MNEKDFFHLFTTFAGLYMLYSAYLATKTGEITTRFYSWIWSGEEWTKDENPLMFKFSLFFYIAGGISILTVTFLSIFNVVELNI